MAQRESEGTPKFGRQNWKGNYVLCILVDIIVNPLLKISDI